MRRRKLILENSLRESESLDLVEFDGGVPTWPLPDDDVKAALIDAYESGAWGQYHGPNVRQLEEEIAAAHGVDHALTCSSGTIAVEIALRSVRVSAGDEVIMAGYDFAGNFRAVEAIGARPVLIDLVKDSWCLNPAAIAEAFSKRTTAVLVSHLHSSLANMRQVVSEAKKYNLAVVEDACQAQLAAAGGRTAGTWGDVGVWSFGGSKILTCGRGGAIFTADPNIHQRAKVYCERGNHAFALSELQAAVVLPQLAKLPERNRQRQQNALLLAERLADLRGWQGVQHHTPASQPAYFKASWFLNEAKARVSRAKFLRSAEEEGLQLGAGFLGFINRPDSRCRKVGDLDHCRRAVNETVVLHHPALLQSAEAVEKLGDRIAALLPTSQSK